jgi:hypothetical protein
MITAQDARGPDRHDGRAPHPTRPRDSLAITLLRFAGGGPVAGHMGTTFGCPPPESHVPETHTVASSEDDVRGEERHRRRAA